MKRTVTDEDGVWEEDGNIRVLLTPSAGYLSRMAANKARRDRKQMERDCVGAFNEECERIMREQTKQKAISNLKRDGRLTPDCEAYLNGL